MHEFRYEPTLHARDLTARLERRLARADARADLKARYQAYKHTWKRPRLDASVVKRRYQNESKRFAWQKARARVAVGDPLLRKLTYHIIEVERMKAMAALRLAVKEERAAFKADPANRRLSYREWVEQQALSHDQAAIAQLRAFAYRMKRTQRTAPISTNSIVCAVADDTPAFALEGYATQVTRDGTVQYVRDGCVELQDKGERIEVGNHRVNEGEHIAGGMALAENKSGEHLKFEGESAFVQQACSLVRWFNEGGDTPLPLSDPQQRILAGYDASSQAISTGEGQHKLSAAEQPDVEQSKHRSGYRPQQ